MQQFLAQPDPSTARPDDSAVSIRDLGLSYGSTRILGGITLDLARGETLALLGPSGCGKTTLLRLVAGLLAPDTGEVRIGGQLVAGPGAFLPPEKRGLGMVFQDYALWPHLGVAQNVAFPLEMRKIPRAERDSRVAAALDRVGLGALANRSPAELSGGQQQRVAIARAIVAEPKIVLFDEPLSNLDRELRESMVAELGALIRSLGLTAIYVTHDQSEALTLADRVAVMSGGSIAQLATPEDLIERPASAKVAEFLRLGTLLDLARSAAGWTLEGSALPLTGGPDSARARLLVPPRALRPLSAGNAALTGEVTSVQYREATYLVQLRLTGSRQELALASPQRLRPGERIGLGLVPEALTWFPADPAGASPPAAPAPVAVAARPEPVPG